MIINNTEQQVLMEARDLNYILPQYVRSFLFYTKGVDPVEIVFPMFSSVPHPTKPGVRVPIRYVPEVSVEARTIAADGSNVAEATEAQIAEADEKDRQIQELKEQVAALTATRGEGGGEGSQAQAQAEAAVATVAVLTEEQKELRRKIAPLINPTVVYEVADRTPRQPEHPASGSPDEMHPRSKDDLKQTKTDLRPEPDIDESKQKPYSKKVSRKASGEPVVEE